MPVQCTELLFERNRYIPHVGTVCVCLCGVTGVELQGGAFTGNRESDKNVSKVLTITCEINIYSFSSANMLK